MRYLQPILLVIGATALGAVSCGVGLAFLAVFTIFRTRPGQDPSLNWGAAIGFMGCLFCGGSLGAIAGFAGAVAWLGQHGQKTWSLTVWAGIALAILAEVVIGTLVMGRDFAGELLAGANISREIWSSVAIVTVASATLGGILAGFGEACFTRRKAPARFRRSVG